MEWFRLQRQVALGRLRWFVLLLAGLLVSLFAGVAVISTPVGAVDAVWDNQSLVYNNTTYQPLTDRDKIKKMGIPEYSLVYEAEGQSGDIKVIYFPPNTDMVTAESANFVELSLQNSGDYSQKSTKTISTQRASDNTTACDVAGIGWAVCPLSHWIAQGLDWMYGVLDGFLVSQPLRINDTKDGMYQAWNIMRSFANAAFVVMFLIIIYSYISSVGLDNYGIKKMLPRLIVAAILVNLSYYICALAIDLSNISGKALQDLFIEIRNSIQTTGANNHGAIFSAESITSAVLSGAGGTVALGIGGFLLLAETGGAASAATILLLPLLVGAAVTLVVVLLVIAARQALIVILTIISPLAFVCYLLPGTEKWFDKWKDTFFTMLIFFPAFSAVFGGSQLASLVILQNADTIIMAILGLGVQIAPLALAPLILKLSGGLLNRFAGVLNDPTKGLIDRSRNFAQEQSKLWAQKRSLGLKDEDLKPHHLVRRAGRWANFKQRERKERIDNYQSKADAAYEESRRHARQDKMRRETEERRQMASKQLDVSWSNHQLHDADARSRDLKLRTMSSRAELGEAKLNTRYEAFKTEQGEDYGLADLRYEARITSRNLAIQSLASQSAKRVQDAMLSQDIKDNIHLQRLAGEVEDLYYGNERGSMRTLAVAVQSVNAANEDSIKNADIIITSGNYKDSEVTQLSLGNSGNTGLTITDDVRIAAIRRIAGGKNAAEIQNLLHEVDIPNLSEEFRQELGTALISNPSKPAWIGAGVASQIMQGEITTTGDSFLRNTMTTAINNHKLSAETLVTQDKTYLEYLQAAMNDDAFRNTLNAGARNIMRAEINKMKTDNRFSGRIGERIDAINAIEDRL